LSCTIFIDKKTSKYSGLFLWENRKKQPTVDVTSTSSLFNIFKQTATKQAQQPTLFFAHLMPFTFMIEVLMDQMRMLI